MMTTPSKLNPEAIRTEAQKAAWLYDTTTHANPYPWDTPEASIFCAAFDAAKQTMLESCAAPPKVMAPNINKMAGHYAQSVGTYYRNDGNPHIASRGVGC